MNKLLKNILAALFAVVLVTGIAVAQPGMDHPGGPRPEGPDFDGDELPMHPDYGMPGMPCPADCPMAMQNGRQPMQFDLDKVVYTDFGFVFVNEPDNAIDLIVREDSSMRRAGRYLCDKALGRHDVKNIIRPIGLKIVDGNIVFLASAQDSAYLGVLSATPQTHDAAGETDSLALVAMVGLSAHADGFNICDAMHELIIVGFNASGYTVDVVDITDGLEHISNQSVCDHFTYHIPKQSERIKMSDPYGIGLTVVAVIVVFFALMCIALILKGFGKAIVKFQNRNAQQAAPASNAKVVSSEDTAGDVYAAIAAALYLYDDELHDEEDAVLTIQKVERAWTPWNAKVYNMNHYFNNRNK